MCVVYPCFYLSLVCLSSFNTLLCNCNCCFFSVQHMKIHDIQKAPTLFTAMSFNSTFSDRKKSNNVFLLSSSIERRISLAGGRTRPLLKNRRQTGDFLLSHSKSEQVLPRSNLGRARRSRTTTQQSSHRLQWDAPNSPQNCPFPFNDYHTHTHTHAVQIALRGPLK